jgi:hypothetical protein
VDAATTINNINDRIIFFIVFSFAQEWISDAGMTKQLERCF